MTNSSKTRLQIVGGKDFQPRRRRGRKPNSQTSAPKTIPERWADLIEVREMLLRATELYQQQVEALMRRSAGKSDAAGDRIS